MLKVIKFMSIVIDHVDKLGIKIISDLFVKANALCKLSLFIVGFFSIIIILFIKWSIYFSIYISYPVWLITNLTHKNQIKDNSLLFFSENLLFLFLWLLLQSILDNSLFLVDSTFIYKVFVQ